MEEKYNFVRFEAFRGDIDKFKLIHRSLIDEHCMYLAVENGHVKIVEYLKSLGYKVDFRSVFNIIYYCHIPMLKYLVENKDIKLIPNFYYSTIYPGEKYLEIIKYLISLNTPIPNDAITMASQKGLTDIVKLLSEASELMKINEKINNLSIK